MPDPKNGDSDDHEMWSGFGRVYRAMLTAREVDRVESELVRQRQAKVAELTKQIEMLSAMNAEGRKKNEIEAAQAQITRRSPRL